MYEDLFLEKMFERMLEHYKENQTMSRSLFIQIIKDENRRFLTNEIMTDLYGELEIENRHLSPASSINGPRP
jgi:hypothetical protein